MAVVIRSPGAMARAGFESALLAAALAGAGCHEPNPAYLLEAPGPDRGAGAAMDAAVPGGVTVACPADPALALCVRFERAARDESPHALPVVAREVTYLAGPDGYAASVTADSRISVADAAPLTAARLTLEAWVRPRVLLPAGARAGVVDKHGTYGLFIHAGGALRCIIGGVSVLVEGAVRAGVWTALACVAGAEGVSLWQDGVLKAITREPPQVERTAAPLAIGGNSPGFGGDSPDPLDGLLDNVRVWRSARTAEQLCAVAPSCPRARP